VGQDEILRRVDNPPERRLPTGAQLDKLPHDRTVPCGLSISLPRSVWEHILARADERQTSLRELRRSQERVNTAPWAPEGDWYKDFGSFMICGSGEYPKTVLAKDMAPFGTRIE
jgi:hypothetical protein